MSQYPNQKNAESSQAHCFYWGKKLSNHSASIRLARTFFTADRFMQKFFILALSTALMSGCAKHLPDCDDNEIKSLIADRVLGDKSAPLEFSGFRENPTPETRINPALEKACIAEITTNHKFRAAMAGLEDQPGLNAIVARLRSSEIRLFLGPEAIKGWLHFIPDSNRNKTKLIELYSLANLLTSFKNLQDQYEEADPLHFLMASNPQMSHFTIEFSDDDLDTIDEFFRYRSDSLDQFEQLLRKFSSYPDGIAILEALSQAQDRAELEQLTQTLANKAQ